jgi:hypothetical protein
MSAAPRLSVVPNATGHPVEADTCGAASHVLIVDDIRDAMTLVDLIPDANVRTIDVFRGMDDEEIEDLAGNLYVLVILPKGASQDIISRARAVVDRLEEVADETHFVIWPSWPAGTPLGAPNGLDSPGAILAWLRLLPEFDPPQPTREEKGGKRRKSNDEHAGDEAQADRWPKGLLVLAEDRGNFGYVEKDYGLKCAVKFKSQSGHTNTPLLSKSILVPQGNPAGAQETRDDDEEEVVDRWPKAQPLAFHGLAGKMVAALDEHTEADPVATLVQILTTFSNMIGRGPHFAVGADLHYLNLMIALVGPTASGRKGSSLGIARFGIDPFDPDWAKACIKSGLVSGEGLIHHVRDAVYKDEDVREKGGRVIGQQRVMADPGVSDKRLLVIESEMSRVLKAMNRESNTLSDVIRQAWDSGRLATMGKHEASIATDAHVSIIAHVTRADVEKHLTKEDSSNGFANRFLWLAVRRSKELPDGGDLYSEEFAREWEPIKHELEQVVAFARQCGRMKRDRDAAKLWREVYGKLTAGKAGLLGAILGRAEPQVMRLACIYALFDQTDTVRSEHLSAALALWQFCEDSTKYIFGNSLANADAEKLLNAIRSSPGGLSRTQITSDVFNGKKTKTVISGLLTELLTEGHVHRTTEKTGSHRPTEWWKPGREGAEHAAK